MKVYIGIDWSENKHDVCFLDETGEVLLVKQIPTGGSLRVFLGWS